VHGIHQIFPNSNIPAYASSMPKNLTNNSAATRCRMQLIPRPLSCAVCPRSTGPGKYLVYALHRREMQRVIIPCNKISLGLFHKDYVKHGA